MTHDIEKEYAKARVYFAKTHPEWTCTVEQECFVVQLNWQNSTYFNGQGVTHNARQYRHIVKLYPDGKFLAIDATVDDETSVGLGGVHIGREAFAGKSWNFHYEKELGYDHDTKKLGIQTYKFSTSQIQKPVREYFEEQGYKYKIYSIKEDFRALDGRVKLTVGVLFSVIGLIFALCLLLAFNDPSLEIKSTVNGITTIKQMGDVPLLSKAIMLLFPATFISVGTLCITNFMKYNRV